jgi:tripartite-type tricarboxylate transporter receptor subunit TctC
MQIARRQIMRLAAGATAFPIVSFVAIAEDFPSRPITWVVPFPAGGPVDTVARIMTDPMSRLLQQPIVIENVSGAAGSIGAGRVARAPPDGYMLIHGIWSTHVVNGAVYRLSYDVFDDFAPIAHLTDASQIVVARKSMPADDLQALSHGYRQILKRRWRGLPVREAPSMFLVCSFRTSPEHNLVLYIIAVVLPRCRICWPSGSI